MSDFQFIGKPFRREEDRRLLRGFGEYTDDMHFDDLAHLVVVRSPHAHARILTLDTSFASEMPGVLCVLDAENWMTQGLPLETPVEITVDFDDGRPMNCVKRPVFAKNRVCFVGDTVAMVVARTMNQALAGAEAVEVDYEELGVVADVASAMHSNAALVHENFSTNAVFQTEGGDRNATQRAFDDAAHVTTLDFRCTRVTGNPIEPRTYTGRYDHRQERYTLYASTQLAHVTRRWLCEQIFDLPLDKIRVVAPDVGGGFGTKAYCYPELPAVLLAARLTGRSVRFCATRSESLQSDSHARDVTFQGRIALDERAKITAMSVDATGSFGAYVGNYAALPINRIASTVTNIYDVENAHTSVTGVYTNTSPTDPYRGVGEPPITLCERLIENAARELEMDPMELRSRNYVRFEQYPYTTVLGEVYDSGDPAEQQRRLLELVGYEQLRHERSELKARGIRLGVGSAAFVDRAGTGASRAGNPESGSAGTWEAGRVEVYSDGRVMLSVGTHSHGQGHATTFRQIAADVLHVPLERISFQQGDTDRDPGNFGTGAQRSLVTAGMAVFSASRRIIAKATTLAAHLFEAAEADVSYEAGHFEIAGTDRRLPFTQVARMAYLGADYPTADFDLGLDETVRYDVTADTYPTGMLLVAVIVDELTGVVTLRNCWAVHDCGRIVNPLVVDGQIHGGLTQAAGQALLEQVYYDEQGQLLSGSFMDYAMPRADDVPAFELDYLETLSPHNALGVKGVGEIGSNSGPAAIGNAVVDALWDLGVHHIDPPHTPLRVWQAIQTALRQN